MYTPEKSQQEILVENITHYMRERGWSQNELSRRLNITSAGVNSWFKKGVMPRPEIIDKLCQLFNVTRNELTSDRSAIPNLSVPAAYPVPILGAICAGNGIVSDESFDGYFFVDRSIRADYCLNVEGDSMTGANIYHGDIAFIKKSYDFLDGQIYAVRFGEYRSASLKKVYRQPGGLLLMPCNDKYKPLVVKEEDTLIVGELIGVYHPK